MIAPVAVALAALMMWYQQGHGTLMLVHGVRETDYRDFLASCRPGSGTVRVTLTQGVPGLRSGAAVGVTFSTASRAIDATGVGVVDEERGVVVPAISLPASSPLFAAMERADHLQLTIAHRVGYRVSTSGSRDVIRAFVAACGRAQG